MELKVRLDADLYQRLLLVVALTLPCYLLLPGRILAALAPLALAAATLRSALRLDVADRAVLVTGCDTGFGLALAKHLTSLGFRVFAGCLLGDKDGPGAAELRAIANPRLVVLQLDVTKQEDWDAALRTVQSKLEPGAGLWGIVNNAGWATFGEMEWVAMETYRRALDINVLGLIAGVKTFLPLIRISRGRVVTITSGLGRMAVPTRSPYCVTKYALEGALDCLRYEMAPFGVAVSILEPGNFIAGTNIFNESFVKSQAVIYHIMISSYKISVLFLILINQNLMWDGMSEEVKGAYGREYFDKKVEIMRSYMNNGIPDIQPVIDSYTDALLDAFPQARYQTMDLYFKVRCFVATHCPEMVYHWLYIGYTSR